MELEQVVIDIVGALVAVDSSRVPFKAFQPGVGPYGEPQLVRAVSEHLNSLPAYGGTARTQRTPDLFLPKRWALEFKLARPFGDNGKEAENWSVNLLHPYEGSTSIIGDCLKLEKLDGPERRAAIVIGYEHTPPQVSLVPLLNAFELVATGVMGIRLGQRHQVVRAGLVHPVHQQLTVSAWEVLRRAI
ncbi:MAG: hypothetical protein ACM3YF_05980 [Candidatus Zixiibacteriota bacterium]